MKKPTILVVDDEKIVRSYIGNILKMAGYDVIEAAGGAEALEHLKRSDGAVALLVTDIRMPEMDGATLGRRVAEEKQNLPILYISGYPFDIEAQREHHLRNACGFLPKPFTREAFMKAVDECLGPAAEAATTG